MKVARLCPLIVDEGGNRIFIQSVCDGEPWRYRMTKEDVLATAGALLQAAARWERWEASEKRRADLASMSPEPERV